MLLELKELSARDGIEIFEMIKEIGPGENGFVNSGYDMSYDEFSGYLEDNINYSKGINLREGYVPQTIYWLFMNSRPVGIVKLRHFLNDFLRNHGGHIGYCIRPSERGKGYGTIILKEVLKKAEEKGIKEALVVCDAVNALSRKVIEANGGCLEEIKDGECKYWIDLKKEKAYMKRSSDYNIQSLISNLKQRNIDAYYFENIEQARNKIIEMIPKAGTVGIGNSQTLKSMRISEALSERGNIVFDKTTSRTKEEAKEQKRKALLADWYITGTNALSMEGHLVNMDHSGNRAAAMIFGPEKVIVVVGINKIEGTLDEAVKRVRNVSAPANAKRAGFKPPCVELGKCIDCRSPERVCFNLVVIEGQAVKDRMTVIIVDESLGF